jgi:dihydrofolate reductase
MFNAAPKYVVSNTLREPLSWAGTTLISGSSDEIADTIRAIRASEADGKDIQVIGSGVLVRSLLAHDLLDELRLLVHPLVLGNGRRLFAEGTAPAILRLVESVATSTGLMILTYRPA